MSDFESSGVSGSVSESGGGADNSPSVPQTGIETDSNSQGETPVQDQQAQSAETEQTSAAPPAEPEIPETDEDLANLSERERTPLVAQRQRLRELNKYQAEAEAFKTSVAPVADWVTQRGGGDPQAGLALVQADTQMVDALFAPDPQDRRGFYEALRTQDPQAFDRLIDDVSEADIVRDKIMQQLSNEQLMQIATERGLGLAPQDTDRPEDVPAEVWNAMAPQIREGFYDMTRAAQDWHLKDAAERQQWNTEQQQAKQQAEAKATQAYTQQVEKFKTETYTSIRSMVQQSLAQHFSNDKEGLNFVLNATETAVWSSPEGQALWGEIEALIEAGNERGFRQKMPLLVAQAKAVASKQADYFNGQQSKARQFDELMRLASQEEILAYVARLRGGQKQPAPGTGLPRANGQRDSRPDPSKAGQYDRDNVKSYWPGN